MHFAAYTHTSTCERDKKSKQQNPRWKQLLWLGIEIGDCEWSGRGRAARRERQRAGEREAPAPHCGWWWCEARTKAKKPKIPEPPYEPFMGSRTGFWRYIGASVRNEALMLSVVSSRHGFTTIPAFSTQRTAVLTQNSKYVSRVPVISQNALQKIKLRVIKSNIQYKK